MEITDAILEPEQELELSQLPEEFFQEELPEEGLPEQDPQSRPPSHIPWPEITIGIIALLAALVLGVTLFYAYPHIAAERQAAETLPPTVPAITLPAATQAATEAETLPVEQEDPEAGRHQEQDPEEEPEEEPLPTIEPIIEPEANPYGRLDFQYNRQNYLYCLRQESYPGIDVSAFQRKIDWQRVKNSGIRFAMLRLGYRGYETGRLVKDEYIDQNLKATQEVGMPIGAYFFSQALNIREVDEEIAFMLRVLGDYPLQMPIVLDWEIPTEDARTAKMDARTLTALQEYFCETMEEKGFTPMVYFNPHQANTLLYLDKLEDYPFWLAMYTDRMTYPYHVEMWQYTDSGKVPGIEGNVDINVYMPKDAITP